jgi:hypothetical protein
MDEFKRILGKSMDEIADNIAAGDPETLRRLDGIDRTEYKILRIETARVKWASRGQIAQYTIIFWLPLSMYSLKWGIMVGVPFHLISLGCYLYSYLLRRRILFLKSIPM